jgi:DNA-binding GntR family transcriptional regulator
VATARIARVEHKTLEERVYDGLVRLIATGSLAPGASLDEQMLAEELGVSRTPLRAALARLAQEGLVVTTAYRGASVRRVTAKEVAGLYEVRIALEQLAVRRAAGYASEAQLAQMEVVVERCEAARLGGDPEALADADTEFHRLIAAAADNTTLAETLESLDLRIQGLRHLALADSPVSRHEPPSETHDRRQIVEAIRRGDGGTASTLIARHIDQVRRAVHAHLVIEESDR